MLTWIDQYSLRAFQDIAPGIATEELIEDREEYVYLASRSPRIALFARSMIEAIDEELTRRQAATKKGSS